MTEEILALCRAMGAAEDREALLRPLVRAAETGLTARLRDGVRAEDCGSAFPLAAAMLAMDGLESGEGGVTAFTAGEVTIRRGQAVSRRAQAERLMGPWLRSGSVAFRGVPG